jgi:hypothetical protein
MSAKPPIEHHQPFAGFLVPNTTPIPDQLVDELLPILSGAEIKVVLYICRRTFGFKKQSDNISINQMLRGVIRRDGTPLDGGVGLSKPTLLRAIKSLSEKQIIIAERRGSAENGNEPTNYRLRMAASLGQKMNQGSSQNFTKPLVKKVAPQQTGLQKTEQQQQRDARNAVAPPAKDPQVVVALMSQGIAQKAAERLAGRYSPQRIAEKIEFLQFLKNTDPKKVKSPQGWLRRAIEENYAAPDGFQTVAEREAELAEKQRQQAAIDRAFAQQDQRRQEERLKRQKAADEHLAHVKRHYGTNQHELAVWTQVLAALKTAQPATTFQAYIANTILLKLNQSDAVIGVANRLALDWVQNQLADQIQRQLSHHVGGHQLTLTFINLSQQESRGEEPKSTDAVGARGTNFFDHNRVKSHG